MIQLKALLSFANLVDEALNPRSNGNIVGFNLSVLLDFFILAVGFFYYFDPRVHRSIIYGDQPRNRLGTVPSVVVIIYLTCEELNAPKLWFIPAQY